ncbi:hypothetical protein FIBSPDRAFT_960044 [Athelia psychrophila]|uniref:Uncharacterized protein n=1 Tax=Athelia psychrophila TaxID=1759441 RepID=A0A166CTB8_9AGAM|nr:hypothetical protein FIBSPDRAFT_960044 [Fibularhizoctonia sp. CBS 109695]
MSAYSQDLESTRRIQTQLASAWQQGRDYWESHPHEKPNATQMGVDDYLVQTGLLSLQLCVAQHATPPRTPEPISPESSLRSPTFSLFSRLDSRGHQPRQIALHPVHALHSIAAPSTVWLHFQEILEMQERNFEIKPQRGRRKDKS